MKKQIRENVFETNSSSVHSLTIVPKKEYRKWLEGELVYDECKDKLVPITDEIKKDMEENYYCSDYYTYDRYEDKKGRYFELFEESYTTESGDEIVAFGYSGYNG